MTTLSTPAPNAVRSQKGSLTVKASPTGGPSTVDPLVPPLQDNDRLLATIREVTGDSEVDARRKLYREELKPGGEICREMLERGVAPYVWSEKLAAFYAENDGFLYGSIAWNRRDQKLAMRSWVAQLLVNYRQAAQNVLCFGDGPGFDSLHLALCGHRVTYFEVSRMDLEFARCIFRDAEAEVSIVENDGELADREFDAISCMDVLEHVPDPPAVVEKFARWLKPGGVLLVNAPFFLVSPDFPTHLDANRRYSGSLRLYRRFGFRLLNGSRDWAPLAFSLGPPNGPAGSMLRRLQIRAMGCFFAGARISSAPYAWLARTMGASRSRFLQDLGPS